MAQTNTAPPSLLFFQSDLRMRDNPALWAAARQGNPLICVFVWNPESSGYARPGAASRWWLYYSLQSLADQLAKAGNSLILRMGHAPDVIAGLVRRFGVRHLYWNRPCEPTALEEEQCILSMLEKEGVPATTFHGNTLADPFSILTQARQPYSIFTPFWKHLARNLSPGRPVQAPRKLPPPPSANVPSDPLSSLALLPSSHWAQGLRKFWSPGEEGAHALFREIFEDSRDNLRHGSGPPGPFLHVPSFSPPAFWRNQSAIPVACVRSCLASAQDPSNNNQCHRFSPATGVAGIFPISARACSAHGPPSPTEGIPGFSLALPP